MLTTSITTPNGTMTATLEGDFSLLGKKPYRPRKIQVLPYVKSDYRGKNPAGGRKCVFSQSPEYRKFNAAVARGEIEPAWYGFNP